MNRILHLDCSPRLEGSESARLSRAIVDRLVRKHPGARVIVRPAAGHDRPCGWRLCPRAGHPRAAADLARGSLADSEILIRELESADCLVIGTPMHNYTVPSALKAWIDHVVRANRTFTHIPTGKLGVLADRPVYVAVSSGGSFASEPARQPDFLTPYLTAILNTIGLRTIHFFSVQRAAAGGDTLAHARSRAQAELERHFAAVHA
ncbi:NAD(P)H-dependent oxidoreductase [Achromobacter xylosoxidans]